MSVSGDSDVVVELNEGGEINAPELLFPTPPPASSEKSHRVHPPPHRQPNSARYRTRPMQDYPFSTKPLDPTIEHFMTEEDDTNPNQNRPRPVRPFTSRDDGFEKPDFERSPYFSRPFSIHKVAPPVRKRAVRSVKSGRDQPVRLSARYANALPAPERQQLKGSDYIERTKGEETRTKQFEKDFTMRYRMGHPLNTYKRDNVKMWTTNVLDNKMKIRQRELEEYRQHEIANNKRRAIAEKRRQQLLKEQELFEIRMGQGLDQDLEKRVCSYK